MIKARKYRHVKVELFATGLLNPSHMEWTLDGRLLVSEHTAGSLKDITEGGDLRDAQPYASGLKGPAAILPLDDGRILVCETWGGTVRDVSQGGDVSEIEPFAQDLSMPYTIGKTKLSDGREIICVSESFGILYTQLTDITLGGSRSNFKPYVTNIPTIAGGPGLTPLHSWPDRWENYAAANCVKSWIDPGHHGDLHLAIGPLGQIMKVPEGGGEYIQLVKDQHLVAWGLHRIGGMKFHPFEDLLFAVQPEDGSVVAIDPSKPRNYRFEPPVVKGLHCPTCVRFSEDGETMFVCGSGEGVIWKVTNFM